MRYTEVDALKGLAIIGVIVAHINFPNRLTENTMDVVNHLQFIFGWCVIAFFFASGFLIKKTPENLNEQCEFFKKRFLRLVIPCIVFSITYRVIQSGLYFTGQFSWESPIPNNIKEILEFAFTPVGPQFYFLYYLFVLSLLDSVLHQLFSKTTILSLLAILLPIFYSYLAVPMSGYGPEFHLLPMYFFSYVLGRGIFSKQMKINLRVLFIALTSLSITAYISSSLIFFYTIVPVLLIYTLHELPTATQALNRTKIGTFSSGIYVWHAPIILPFVSIACVKIMGGGELIIIPMIVFTILLSITASLITSKFNFLKPWRF